MFKLESLPITIEEDPWKGTVGARKMATPLKIPVCAILIKILVMQIPIYKPGPWSNPGFNHEQSASHLAATCSLPEKQSHIRQMMEDVAQDNRAQAPGSKRKGLCTQDSG
jgi:hypothetical protein